MAVLLFNLVGVIFAFSNWSALSTSSIPLLLKSPGSCIDEGWLEETSTPESSIELDRVRSELSSSMKSSRLIGLYDFKTTPIEYEEYEYFVRVIIYSYPLYLIFVY